MIMMLQSVSAAMLPLVDLWEVEDLERALLCEW